MSKKKTTQPANPSLNMDQQETPKLWNAKQDKHLRGYRAMLIIVIIVMVGMIVGRHFINTPYVYGFEAACLALVIVLIVSLYNRVMKRFEYRVNEQAVSISTAYQQYMNQWQFPYLMLDHRMKIVWYNDAFRKIIKATELEGKSLEEAGLNWGTDKPDWDPIQKELTINEKLYRGLMSQIRLRDKDMPAADSRSFTLMYGLSLMDITVERRLEQENFEQQPAVGLFYVDNYDQIIGDMSEGERPVLEAGIFRALSDLAGNLGGIMNQLERDRYFLQFPRKSLDRLCNEMKFDILERVKKIETGSRYQVTLSVGVGVDKDLTVARRYAGSSVELAMGRGGDQAVVKTKDEQKFFGGLSTSAESNTRVRARLIALALKERIEASDRVLIMGHSNPDMDSLGSALGVYRAALEMKKPANIVISREKHAAVEILYDRVDQDPDHQGAMIDHDEALSLCGPNTLLVVVDVNRKMFTQYGDLLDHVDNIVVIDHHRTAADHISGAAVSYVEPYASSASEMVTELMQYMIETPKLTSVEADGLFAGISLDTKSFTLSTGVRTFEAAAYLRRKGADSMRVRKMFKNDMEDYRAKSRLIANAEIMFGNIAYSSWTTDMANATTVAAQAADELMDVQGIQGSFVVTQVPGQVNISARSLGDINIQRIMEQLGGGGHHTGGGAQLKGATLEETRARIEEIVARSMGI